LSCWLYFWKSWSLCICNVEYYILFAIYVNASTKTNKRVNYTQKVIFTMSPLIITYAMYKRWSDHVRVIYSPWICVCTELLSVSICYWYNSYLPRYIKENKNFQVYIAKYTINLILNNASPVYESSSYYIASRWSMYTYVYFYPKEAIHQRKALDYNYNITGW